MAQRLKKVEFEGKDLVKAWIIVIFAVVMKHAKLLTLVLALLMALPMHAVLKEEDLGKTLSILRKELTKTYLEMEEDMKSSKEMNKRILNNLFSTMSRSNQNALMLYSQKPDYVFDLTYACHEATDQYQDFKKTTLPFRQYVDKMNIEIARYDSLVTSLSKMPTRRLDDSAKVDHDVCLTLAVNIRNNYAETKERMTEYIKYYERAEEQLKTLNDYANVRYNEIQTNIFKNGGEPYWAIIKSMQYQMSKTADSVTEKYTPLEGVSSQWDIKIITFLFLFILIYGTLAIALNIIAIRYVLPKRFRSAEFLKKRTCIILATTTITFALILGVLRATVNQNFLIMASGLLVEYSWLLGVILISLLLRVDGNQIKSAFKIYAPLIVIGFIGKMSGLIDRFLESVEVVAIMLVLGGIFMLFCDRLFNKGSERTELTEARAFRIGLFQCIAMIPGVSRSMATIVGGMAQKLTRRAAAEFSFFLAVPTMAAATALDFLQLFFGDEADASWATRDNLLMLALGCVVAFVVALLAMKWFVAFLTRYGFKAFGVYRIIVGVIILALLWSGHSLVMVD